MEPSTKDPLILQTNVARAHFAAIAALYQLCGYTGTVREDDTVVLASIGTTLVGVVRLVDEHGIAILRGMYLHPDYLRRGIGSQMLVTFERLVIDRHVRNVFCLCGAHLERYYGQIGFLVKEDSLVPGFLVERKNGYQARYGPQIILCRP